jgi:hypothetical protein
MLAETLKEVDTPAEKQKESNNGDKNATQSA